MGSERPRKRPSLADRQRDPPRSAALPPLHLVRAFEATARAGTMRRAAEDIGISHTVVSRHVQRLEAWLRVRLIQSGPRGTRLTREGESYFEAVTRAFGILTTATADIRPAPRERLLRVWCMPGLATRWVTPRLAMIQRALPGTDLILKASDRLPDFDRGDADLMIGFGNPDALPRGAQLLVRPRMFPVASPKYLRGKGFPASIEALAKLPLIHEESRQQWTQWFDTAGVKLTRPLKGPRLSDASLGFDAAVAGMGVVLASSLTTRDEISSGRLVELFKTEIHLGCYFLLAAPRLRKDAGIHSFSEWLATELRSTEHSKLTAAR